MNDLITLVTGSTFEETIIRVLVLLVCVETVSGVMGLIGKSISR